MSLDKLYFAIAMLLAVIVDWYLANTNSWLFTELTKTAIKFSINSNKWHVTFNVWWYTTCITCACIWGLFVATYSRVTRYIAIGLFVAWSISVYKDLDKHSIEVLIPVGNIGIAYCLLLLLSLLPNPLRVNDRLKYNPILENW